MEMKGKSPLMKALIGNQKNLNEGLKAAIKAAPDKMMVKSPSMMMQVKTAMKVRGMGEDAVGKVRGMGEKAVAKVMMKEKAAAKVMMKEKTPAKKALMPDFPDVDGDGNKKESISKASRDAKSTAKMMKNSALKKSTRLSNKEKAEMMARKRAAGTDADSMRRKQLNEEVEKQLEGVSVFGAAGKEAEKKAITAAREELNKKRAKSPK